MEDKDMKKLINEIIKDKDLDKEISNLEEEIFFSEDIPSINEDEKNMIKNKVYAKLDNKNSSNKRSNILKFPKKYIKVASIGILIFGVVTCGTPIARAVIENIYKYNQSVGSMVESTGSVYVLEKPISKNIDGRNITLESLVLDIGNKQLITKTIGEGTQVERSASIKIGENIIESNNYSQAWGDTTWMISHEFSGDFEYKNGETIVYTLLSKDDKKIDFEVKLNEATSVSDYSSLGSTDTKSKVSITAVSVEDNNVLDVNFIDKIEGNNSNIYSYGKAFYSDEYDTGVVLKDVNGKVVRGKLIHHGDRGNHFQFDISNLTKPYTIEIPSITANMYGTLEGDKIKLSLPKEGSLDLNKEIILNGTNEKIVKENDKVLVKSIEKFEDNQYKINFEYPKNSSSEFKISDLSFYGVKGILGMNRDFSGYSSDINVDSEILESIIIEPNNKNKTNIEFNVYPKEYKIEGNWKIIIE